MKALYCRSCGDMFNIKKEHKQCSCGKTMGKYINWHSAVYRGNEAVPIGIENGPLRKGIMDMDVYEHIDKDDSITSKSYIVSYVIIESDLTFFKEENFKKYKLKNNQKTKGGISKK